MSLISMVTKDDEDENENDHAGCDGGVTVKTASRSQQLPS